MLCNQGARLHFGLLDNGKRLKAEFRVILQQQVQVRSCELMQTDINGVQRMNQIELSRRLPLATYGFVDSRAVLA